MANTLNLPEIASEARVIHQSLHGYSEGHRLLESSFKLPDDLTRLMLRMSDLSGPSIVRGFEEYITGYPLASINAYALAKTWYASEMPRPGCVWTHTLVIPIQTLSMIPSLITLVELFKRPRGEAIRGQYSDDLTIDDVYSAKIISPDVMSAMTLGQLFWSYYENRGPSVLAAQTSKEFEQIIFALWSQQWPRLRCEFTFCTGSLSARKMIDRAFDVQCVPTTLSRDVLRSSVDKSSVEPILLPSNDTNLLSKISQNPLSDALKPGPFRQFLWAAVDDDAGRNDFTNFTTIFDAICARPEVGSLISLVARIFPEPSSGSRLKCLLFGNSRPDALHLDYDERDVLLALGTTKDFQSFDTEALSIKNRVGRLSVEDPDSARWLIEQLFRSTLTPIAEDILAGLVATIDQGTASGVAREQPKFLPGLFRAKPSLASSSQLWVAGANRKRELFDAVASHKHLDSSLVAGIVAALLDSHSDSFIRRALDLWGRDAVFAVLDWVETHDREMSRNCSEALAFHLDFVMDWVEENTSRQFKSLIAVAHVVAPYSSRISRRDSTVWLRTWGYIQNSPDESQKDYIAAFLLALAFCGAPPSPLDLVSESFERLYDSAWDEKLSDDAWSLVEPYVPELGWLTNWDKCERLARGLTAAFIRHGWSPQELRRLIQNPKTVRRILESAEEVKGGKEFFNILR